MVAAAATVMDKVAAVSPEALRYQLDLVRLWAPADHAREIITIDQAALRHATRDERKIRFNEIVRHGRAVARACRRANAPAI